MYINRIRQQLHERYRRLKYSDYQTITKHLYLFLKFLNETPLIFSILSEIKDKAKKYSDWEPKYMSSGSTDLDLPDDELEYSALCYAILEKCINEPKKITDLAIKLHVIGTLNDHVKYFNELFVENLYSYINDRLENGDFILYLLNKFKVRSEWFDREFLYNLYISDTKHGEELMKKSLRQYLFDQGIDFPFSEPLTASGKPDLVYGLETQNPLTLEVKLFNPDSGYSESYLRKGFVQAIKYASDYNKPFGYYLIFNVSIYDITFLLNNKSSDVIKIENGDKTIFVVVVNLIAEKTASQKGKLKSYEITEDYLTSEENE